MPYLRPSQDHMTARLCFGTAQLGLPYGVANTHGMPNEADADMMIREALERGISLFDTARAYGESETRLGVMHDTLAAHAATVITKLAPLELQEGEALAALEARVEASVFASCEQLRMTCLPYVLLHRAAHLQMYEGLIWQRLLALQQRGVISHLGVSVSTPDEAMFALSRPQVSCVQLPFNLVDTRWAAAGLPAAFMARRDVLVCVRSAFLQGVLMQDARQWPVLDVSKAQSVAGLLDEWVAAFGREDRVDLCLAYLRSQPWIDVIVLGMETLAQLRQNVALFETDSLRAEECDLIHARMPALPEAFLNPAFWPQKEC